MIAVADEIIAQHHGRLVAAKVVDRRAVAAQLGLVQDVIVDERRHVDHLHHCRQHEMFLADLAAGLAGQ